MQLSDLSLKPAFRATSLKSVKLSRTASECEKSITSGEGLCNPDLQALAFYYLDHCVALMRSKFESDLPEELEQVVELYHAMTTRFGTSMYAYLLLICTREFRHCNSPDQSIINLLGETNTAALAAGIKAGGGNAAISRIASDTKGVTLGSWCEALRAGFYKLNWSPMYGGSKWGGIAKVLAKYVDGEMPLVTMLDQSFSLQHNTSAIFNKGMIYRRETASLEVLLDLQHAGQIVNLACDLFLGQHDPLNIRGYKTNESERQILEVLKSVHSVMVLYFEKEFSNHVDWDAVIASNPKTKNNILAGFKQAAFKAFGVYDTKPVADKVTPNPEYYHIGEDEKYEKIVRKKK